LKWGSSPKRLYSAKISTRATGMKFSG